MSDSRQDYRHDSPPRRKDSPPRSSTLPSRAAVSRGTDSKRDRSPRLDDRRDRGHHEAHARRSSPRRSQNRRGRSPSPLPRPIRDNRGRELFEDKLKGPPKEAPSGRHREPRDLGERSRARDARPLSPRRPAQSPRRAADDYDASRTRHGGRSISPLSSASKRQRSRSPLPYPSSRSKRSKRDRERDHDRSRRHRGDRGDLLDDERDSSRRERPRSPYDTRSPSPRTRRGNPQSREDLFDSSRTRRYSRSPRGAHGRRPARSPQGESRRRSRDPVSRARLDSQERRPGSLRSLDGRDRNAGGPERSSSRSGANSMNFNPTRQAADDRISQDRALDTFSGTKGHSPRKEGTVPSRGESPRPRSPYGSDTGGHDSRRQQLPQRTSNTDDPRSGDRDQRSRGDRTTPPPLSRGFTKSAFSGHQKSPRSDSRHRQDESTAQPVRNVFRGDDESSKPPSHQLPSKPVSSTARNDGRSTPSIAEDKMDGVEQQRSSNSQGQPTASSPAASTSNSKFSFAFKATSKGPVTAPKLEISQKLSAPPKKDQPQPVADERSRDRDNGRGHGRGHDRDRERDRYRERERERERDWDRNGGRNRNRDHDRDRDQERERERERDRDRDRNREREHDLERPVDRPRDILRDAPKGPASSRPQLPAKPPPPQPEKPRIRMVKKIERKLKPKPQLPDELRTSWSIFFRKQGNESVIGSGTYGKVYKGVHVYTKKLVALKKIRMEGERDGFPVTAIREIKLLQSLKHKNIVDLQEVMVERHDCYMVFEYLSHDLTGLLNHPSYTLDPAQRKHLAMQLFEGLDYLHHRGVLHRDIKAANILVSSSGILKFADFGLARFYAKRHQYDYTNRVVTIWYRSPELLLGETQYGAPVDIWSAACVMVEIFTRHAIFPGDGSEVNQLDTIYAVLGTPNRQEWPNLPEMPWFELLRPSYRRPSAFVEKYQEKLPPAAFDLLSQMFQYDPAKRPSAAEVLQHAYFTTELPRARQAIELENIQGDWHELESKALRREKERQDREARKAAAATKDAAGGPGNANGAPASKDKERKRAPASHDAQRDSKRHHVQPHGDIGTIGTAEAVVAAALGN